MTSLFCLESPSGRLPFSPEAFLNTWKSRVGFRNSQTSQALKFLEGLESKRVMVCENAPDSSVDGLKWSIYQDQNRPELFVVLGSLSGKEFGTVQYLPEKSRILERDGFTYQRLGQFRAVTEQMKDEFLGIKK